MELRINRAIQEHAKVSYASETGGAPSPGVVDCGEGINTVLIPPAAREAFEGLTFEMVRAYPHSPSLREAIVEYWADYAALSPRRVCYCDGSIGGIYLVNRLFLEPGDRVLGYVPQFSEYETDVAMRGCLYDGLPLLPAANYRFDPAPLLAALRPEHKLVYLDNPNNPTGQVIPLADVEAVLTAALKLGVGVIVDEAYGDYMPKENSAATLIDRYSNLIVLKTFSKGFGLAGLRAGYILLPDALVDSMSNITNPYVISAVSRAIAAHVLRDGSFLPQLQSRTAAIKGRLLKTWRSLTVAHTCPTVSICLITHPDPALDLAAEFARRGVLVISGSDFYGMGKNSVRLRVPAAENMGAVLAAMEEIDRL